MDAGDRETQRQTTGGIETQRQTSQVKIDYVTKLIEKIRQLMRKLDKENINCFFTYVTSKKSGSLCNNTELSNIVNATITRMECSEFRVGPWVERTEFLHPITNETLERSDIDHLTRDGGLKKLTSEMVAILLSAGECYFFFYTSCFL